MRTKVYQITNDLLSQQDREIVSSCSLPNFQIYRTKNLRQKLLHDLENAGVATKIPEGKIEMLALRLYLKRIKPRKRCPQRAIRYNDDRPCYTKINIRFENQSDYFYLRSSRSHLRVSVSFLMDMALRLYLRLAVRILFLRLTKSKLKAKWHRYIDGFSNYTEVVVKDDASGLIFTEKNIFNLNTS